MSKYASLPVAILLICLLGGCAAGLLALAFKALAVGALYAEVSSLFGHASSEFTLYFDGYDTGRHPATDGTLNLDGLPVGHHLLTLADTDKMVGFHKHVEIAANHSLDLGSVTPIQGGVHLRPGQAPGQRHQRTSGGGARGRGLRRRRHHPAGRGPADHAAPAE